MNDKKKNMIITIMVLIFIVIIGSFMYASYRADDDVVALKDKVENGYLYSPGSGVKIKIPEEVQMYYAENKDVNTMYYIEKSANKLNVEKEKGDNNTFGYCIIVQSSAYVPIENDMESNIGDFKKEKVVEKEGYTFHLYITDLEKEEIAEKVLNEMVEGTARYASQQN